MYHAAEGAPAPARAAGEAPFPVVLVSPYELGRQPFDSPRRRRGCARRGFRCAASTSRASRGRGRRAPRVRKPGGSFRSRPANNHSSAGAPDPHISPPNRRFRERGMMVTMRHGVRRRPPNKRRAPMPNDASISPKRRRRIQIDGSKRQVMRGRPCRGERCPPTSAIRSRGDLWGLRAAAAAWRAQPRGSRPAGQASPNSAGAAAALMNAERRR